MLSRISASGLELLMSSRILPRLRSIYASAPTWRRTLSSTSQTLITTTSTTNSSTTTSSVRWRTLSHPGLATTTMSSAERMRILNGTLVLNGLESSEMQMPVTRIIVPASISFNG